MKNAKELSKYLNNQYSIYFRLASFLVGEELMAEQIVLDSVNSELLQNEEVSEPEYLNEKILTRIYRISAQRYKTTKTSEDEYFYLSLNEKFIYFLREFLFYQVGSIADLLDLTEIDILEGINSARSKLSFKLERNRAPGVNLGIS